MVSMLPCGQSLNALTICFAAGPVRPTGTGGFPEAPSGWCGVVRVSTVSPTTIAAAARHARPTATYRERREDNLQPRYRERPVRGMRWRYYRLYSNGHVQRTSQAGE